MTKVPYVAIEGPIGVGKTTLARALASALNFKCYEEVVEGHPLLKAFYDNMEQTSFQTEMFFLTHRYEQLEAISRDLQAGQSIVADYHIFKNKLFAEQTLKKHHYNKFTQIYDILIKDLPSPNVLVYLKASLDELLFRIKKRNRAAEEHLSADYLKQLVQSYEQWIPAFKSQHPEVVVLEIETDALNLADNPEHIHAALNLIQKHIQQGVSQ
ncbi:deoxyguanosine kinase [Pullulanibacillus camelliae]|uniref:Deoxyguanosine kinase n=1 Tax=Pullulanibacillus camelliae TaxID=1707096 RepID=A0A8J2YJR1_9BACL|nr:deoxynucleoside kinase [Pullulanibacillus camelliae]GGE48049.1 deoxyguanosine kinase [Pullulanibacillus camelliae]